MEIRNLDVEDRKRVLFRTDPTKGDYIEKMRWIENPYTAYNFAILTGKKGIETIKFELVGEETLYVYATDSDPVLAQLALRGHHE